MSSKRLLILFLLFLSLAAAGSVYTYIDTQKQLLGYVPAASQSASVTSRNLADNQAPEQSANASSVAPAKSPVLAPEAKPLPTEPSAFQLPRSSPETLEPHTFFVGDKKYEIAIKASSTVYELMDSFKQQGDISFQGKNSSGLGFFVEEINGLKNNPSKGFYWIYYINGKSASVGISNYILRPGDIISWKYEKPQF